MRCWGFKLRSLTAAEVEEAVAVAVAVAVAALHEDETKRGTPAHALPACRFRSGGIRCGGGRAAVVSSHPQTHLREQEQAGGLC